MSSFARRGRLLTVYSRDLRNKYYIISDKEFFLGKQMPFPGYRNRSARHYAIDQQTVNTRDPSDQ